MLRKAFLLWPGEKGTLSLKRQSHGEEDVPGVGLGFIPGDQDTVGGTVVQRKAHEQFSGRQEKDPDTS